MKAWLLACIPLFLCFGCSENNEPAESVSAAPKAAPPVSTKPDPLVDMKALEESYRTAKGVYERSPGNKTAKEAFVAAAVKFGHESMMTTELDPKIKYKQALRIYREVLEIDPENEVAKPESEMIVKIYEQMGKPVPKE